MSVFYFFRDEPHVFSYNYLLISSVNFQTHNFVTACQSIFISRTRAGICVALQKFRPIFVLPKVYISFIYWAISEIVFLLIRQAYLASLHTWVIPSGRVPLPYMEIQYGVVMWLTTRKQNGGYLPACLNFINIKFAFSGLHFFKRI